MPDATERKTLVMCTFFSACLTLAPQEFVSAGVLSVLALLLVSAHLNICKREDEFVALLEKWAPSASTLADPSEPVNVDGVVGKEPP